MRFGDVDSQGEVTPIPDPTDFNISGQVQGDVLYFNGANWVRLAPGTADQSLRTKGAAANPVWANVDNATNLSISGETTGDMLYYNGANWVRLASGTSGNLLQTNGAAAPTWVAPPSGASGSAISSFMSYNGGVSMSSSLTTKTIINYTELFDTGGDFNPTTGIFTAPQNGIYLFNFNCKMDHGGSASNNWHLYINSTNYVIGGVPTAGGYWWNSGSIILSMTTSQTARVYMYGAYTTVSKGQFSGTLLA